MVGVGWGDAAMNRRQFVITGSTALVAGLVAPLNYAEPLDASPMVKAALFDTRYAEAQRFALTARSYDLPTHGFDGDITALWARELKPFWAARGGALVGMTTLSTLCCLEEMARDHWHRVVARIEHRPLVDGTTAHHLQIRDARYDDACTRMASTDPWTAAAHTMLACAAPSRGTVRHAIVADPRRTSGVQSQQILVTWTIAA